jgi:hypothetical protein
MSHGDFPPLTRRAMAGLIFAAVGLAGSASAATPAEQYVSGIADEVMRLANS